jgi:serine/threonine-protein kinase
MSPEQAAGRLDELGPASDVYSLGSTLFCLLTGEPPLHDLPIRVVMDRVQRGEIPRPRDIAPGVPLPLEAICRKAMALKPEDRYVTPRALADDIEHWLADEPVTAWPEPWTVKARRWLGRHRTLSTAVAAGVAVALVGFAIATALLTAANERERQARATAEANYQLARAAVDRYHTEVSQSVLLHEPGMQPLRKKLLEAAREFYEKFATEHAEDVAVPAELARAYFRLAQITADIDSERKGIELHEKAAALFSKLPDADAVQQAELAECWFHIGRLCHLTDQVERSEESFKKSLGLWTQLQQDHPGEERYQAGLANAQNGLGNIYQFTRRLGEAHKSYRQAFEVRKALAEAQPGRAEYQRDLAVTDSNLGMVLQAQGGAGAEAKKAYDAALAIQKQLAADAGHISQYQNDLARTQYNLGNYREAVRIWQALVDRHPAVFDFRMNLAEAYTALAAIHREADNVRKAEEVCLQALALQRDLVDKNPDVPRFHWELGRGYYFLGKLYRADDQKDKAETAFQNCVLIQEELVRTKLPLAHYRFDLTKSYTSLGLLYAQNWKEDKADAALKNALAHLQTLVREHPEDPEYELNLFKALINLGDGARVVKNHKNAADWYTRIIALGASKNQSSLAVPILNALGYAYYRRAEMLTQLGRYPEAIQDWQTAIDRARNDDQKKLLQQPRAWTLAKAGKYEEATLAIGDMADSLEKQTLSRAKDLKEATYDKEKLLYRANLGASVCRFAGVYALCAAAAANDATRAAKERAALAEQYGARAVKLLATVSATGYFKNEANRKRLQDDPELAALRSRADFIKLSSESKAE